jgi:hypothetical protein
MEVFGADEQEAAGSGELHGLCCCVDCGSAWFVLLSCRVCAAAWIVVLHGLCCCMVCAT